MKALIFDCDGVLVDTERDGHRVAFNRAFAAAGIDAEWDVDLYGELLKIAGGKERMTHFFNEAGWPDGQTAATLIPELHKRKTAIFTGLIASGELPLRPRHHAHHRRGARGRRSTRRLHHVRPEGH
jgi:phosphoglycolate phosphatase-like HAD superfamily hydrolase